MLEAAEQQELRHYKSSNPKESRERYEHTLLPLAHYALIERMRIHDFHRFGLLPPDPNFSSVFIGGPIRATAQPGAAQIALEGSGLKVSITGNSRVNLQRPLVEQDGMFLDEDLGQLVAPGAIADAFLREMAANLEEFERQLSWLEPG